jgi:hypothetical protein
MVKHRHEKQTAAAAGNRHHEAQLGEARKQPEQIEELARKEGFGSAVCTIHRNRLPASGKGEQFS